MNHQTQEPGGYEERAADAAVYPPDQRKGPKLVERPRKQDDFHPVK